jgi:hypothetical protein
VSFSTTKQWPLLLWVKASDRVVQCACLSPEPDQIYRSAVTNPSPDSWSGSLKSVPYIFLLSVQSPVTPAWTPRNTISCDYCTIPKVSQVTGSNLYSARPGLALDRRADDTIQRVWTFLYLGVRWVSTGHPPPHHARSLPKKTSSHTQLFHSLTVDAHSHLRTRP